MGLNNNNNRQYYSELKANYENQLELNYGQMISVESNLDIVSAAVTKMEDAILALEEINTTAYNKFSTVCYWHGLKHSETSDIITFDMQTDYSQYLEAIGSIKNSLIEKQTELKNQLEELKQGNINLRSTICMCIDKIQANSEE